MRWLNVARACAWAMAIGGAVAAWTQYLRRSASEPERWICEDVGPEPAPIVWW